MAKKVRDDLTWQDVDTDGFKGALSKAYGSVKVARATARELVEVFDAMFRKEAEKKLAPGTSVLISHKFGKMAIAVVDKVELTKSVSKAKGEKFSL